MNPPEPSTPWPDIRVEDGQQTKFYAVPPDTEDLEQALHDTGWEDFLTCGSENSHMYIKTYRRQHADTPYGFEFLVEIGNWNIVGPLILFTDYLDFLHHYTRWTEAIKNTAIADTIDQLDSTTMISDGLIEAIAAKAKYGWYTGYEQIRSAQRWRDQQRLTPPPAE